METKHDTNEPEALSSDELDIEELDRRLELAAAGQTWNSWCPKEATQLL